MALTPLESKTPRGQPESEVSRAIDVSMNLGMKTDNEQRTKFQRTASLPR